MEQNTALPRLTGALVHKLSKGMNQNMKRFSGASLASLVVCCVAAASAIGGVAVCVRFL
jgi:hypothetical protein